MDPNRLDLTFANRADEAPRMAHRVEHFLNEKKISPALINKILLCVDELITNIIAHAYTDHNEHAVELICKVSNEIIMLELRDDGVPFDPTKQARRPTAGASLENTSIGGLGLHLVTSLMDRVEYEHEGDYNVLRVYKGIE